MNAAFWPPFAWDAVFLCVCDACGFGFVTCRWGHGVCFNLGSSTHASGSEWVDPEDPTVIAETELLGAAASIEAAAKKLEQLKPRAKPKVSEPFFSSPFHYKGLC